VRSLLPFLIIFGIATESVARDPDEVIVSVRKTEENIQDVPIQVTSFDQALIAKEGIRAIGDVAELTPSLQFDTGFWPSDTRLSIRGLFNRAGRPSAAVLIDGIDVISESFESTGGSALLNQRLIDVERIEVARGPQSALYGRAAFAGAVNYVTRRPDDEWTNSISGDVGEGDRYEIRGRVSGPITEDLTFSLIGSHYSLDGDYTNPNTNNDIGGGDSNGIAFALNWEPSETFSAYWNTTYSDDEFEPPAIAFVPANTFRLFLSDGTLIPDGDPDPINDIASAGCLNPPLGGNDSCQWVYTGKMVASETMIDISPDPRTGNEYPGTDDEAFRSTLILEWQLDNDMTLRSATGYTDANQKLNLDTTQRFTVPGPGELYGINSGNGSNARNEFNFEQIYQEFQLSGDAGDEMNWLVGLNAFLEDADDRNTSTFWYRDPTYWACVPNAFVAKAAPCSFEDSEAFDKTIFRDTESYSLFGLLAWQFAEQWKATFEGRWIRDEVEAGADSSELAANILAFGLDGFFGDPDISYIYDYENKPGFVSKVSDTNFLPRVTLEYDATGKTMIYASVAKGIKPPTFNTTDFADPSIAIVQKEELWSYELGTKNTLQDGQLLLNGALFYNEYDDQQVRVQFPPLSGFQPRSGTANAGEVTIWGVEFDATWLPDEYWLLNASYAYTDGEYDSLILADAQPPGVAVSRSEIVKSASFTGDYSGKDTVGTPEHAATFLARYQRSINADFDWYVQGTATYQGERWADLANLVELESYWLANFQVGIERENLFVALYVDNAFDDDTIRYAQEFIDQSQGFQAPEPPVVPQNGVTETFTYPTAYYAYLPQPRTVGVRFSVGTR
jgi:outer membrane receptor protein involved in Fe transport